MEGEDSSGGGGLAEGDVGDGAGAAQNTDPPLALTGVRGDGVKDIAAGVDFQDVGPQRVGAFSGDDHRRFLLVFRTGRAAPRPPPHDFSAGVWLLGVAHVLFIIAAVELVGAVVASVRRPPEVEIHGAVLQLVDEVGSRTQV